MKNYIFAFVSICIVLISWCFNKPENSIYDTDKEMSFSWEEIDVNTYDDLTSIVINDYSFGIQQTWFIPKEIPSNYSWRVYVVDRTNKDSPYYFSWFEPLLYDDRVYWIKILLSENFAYSYPKIYHAYDPQYNDKFIYISLLSKWEYLENNYNTRYEITIIDNDNKERLNVYNSFYWDSFIWKNSKYSFYFISPFVESDIVYPWGEYYSKNRLKQQLFLWFWFFNP